MRNLLAEGAPALKCNIFQTFSSWIKRAWPNRVVFFVADLHSLKSNSVSVPFKNSDGCIL